MVGVIAAFALVHPAALVDAADVFTKAIQDILPNKFALWLI